MCLAIPAGIEELLPDEEAVVTLGGIRKAISVAPIEDIQVGDYVILHGYALNKLIRRRPENPRIVSGAGRGATVRPTNEATLTSSVMLRWHSVSHKNPACCAA